MRSVGLLVERVCPPAEELVETLSKQLAGLTCRPVRETVTAHVGLTE